MQLATWIQLEQLKVSLYPIYDYDHRIYPLPQGLSMTVNVLGAITDVGIAGSLFYFLHRSRTGFKK